MSFRKERVSEMLLGFLASCVREFRDPRVESVSLTDVQVTSDLKLARVFWTVHTLAQSPDKPVTDPMKEKTVQEAAKALEGARGFLKKRMGEELDLRHVPDLDFRYDDSFLRGSRIDYLLHKSGQ